VTIVRVFPSRTRATPIDDLSFFDEVDLFPPKVDEVHVSVSFTWDIPRAEQLAKSWERIAPVRIGGPAIGTRGEAFIPGRYIKSGYVITSRGCPNRCWFCSVWKREGEGIRELPIADGWNILDDNLLACSDEHIRAVFEMLRRQDHKAEFTGGLEAKRLKQWHVDLIRALMPSQVFFAYDTPDDYEPLVQAGKMLRESGYGITSSGNISHRMRAYVLIGWPTDTFEKAEKRLTETMAAGFIPMAMLWRDREGKRDLEWQRFQRKWARPAIMTALAKAQEVKT
jgi:hypothetical protein